MDVDVCHYSDNPLRIGGQWEHTAGHCKNGIMVCSHEWVEGLIDYYQGNKIILNNKTATARDRIADQVVQGANGEILSQL